jgi:hypothetical protein
VAACVSPYCCCPCRVKGTQTISSLHNFSFSKTESRVKVYVFSKLVVQILICSDQIFLSTSKRIRIGQRKFKNSILCNVVYNI